MTNRGSPVSDRPRADNLAGRCGWLVLPQSSRVRRGELATPAACPFSCLYAEGMRAQEVIAADLRLVAAVRRAVSGERGPLPSIGPLNELPDERNATKPGCGTTCHHFHP